jgi:hypothetical protein
MLVHYSNNDSLNLVFLALFTLPAEMMKDYKEKSDTPPCFGNILEFSNNKEGAYEAFFEYIIILTNTVLAGTRRSNVLASSKNLQWYPRRWLLQEAMRLWHYYSWRIHGISGQLNLPIPTANKNNSQTQNTPTMIVVKIKL